MISVPDTGNSSVNRPAFPVPDDDGAAKHLIAGTRLPDVALVATRGASVNLARYQERAVVFVYPMTGTPGVANPPDWDRIPGAHGSTPEAEGFRDTHAQFELLGYEVFGVSSQSPDDQRAFAARTGIPYLLLSDANFAFADALGAAALRDGWRLLPQTADDARAQRHHLSRHLPGASTGQPRARSVAVSHASSRLTASNTEPNMAVVSRPVFVL